MPITRPPSGPYAIAGSLGIGQVLTAVRAMGAPSLKWQRGADPTWVDIAGAEGPSYVYQSADASAMDRVVETVAAVPRFSSPIGSPRKAVVTWAELQLPGGPAASIRKGIVTMANLSIVRAAGSFPVAVILDRFDRADGALGSNWVAINASIAPTIVSGSASGPAATPVRAGWIAQSFQADQEVYARLADDDLNDHYLALRWDTSTSTGYEVIFDCWGAFNATIYKVTAGGSYTQLGVQALAAELTTGDIVGLKAVGTTLKAYVNGTAVLTVTDSTFNRSGLVGFGMIGTAAYDYVGGGPSY